MVILFLCHLSFKYEYERETERESSWCRVEFQKLFLVKLSVHPARSNEINDTHVRRTVAGRTVA